MKYEKLSQLLDISMGRTPSREKSEYWGKGYKWVSIRDLNSKIITETKEQITDLAVKEGRSRIVQKGTLLFSFKLTIGKMAFAGCDLYTNEAIAAFCVKDTKIIDADFLYYALLSANFGGSNQAAMGKTLNSKSLADIQIPLPQLNDQRRIVYLLGKVEGLIAQREQGLEQLDALLKSVFLKMFGDSIQSDHDTTLGAFIEILTDYHANGSYETLRNHVHLSTEEDYALMVRTTDLEKNNFTIGCNYITKNAYDYLEKSRVFGGEIIINKIGSAGKIYLMPMLNRPVSLGMNAFLLRFSKGLNVIFAYHFLSSEIGSQRIQKLVKGAVTKTITKDAVRSIRIPIVSIIRQNEFAVFVEKVEGVKALYKKNLSELESLYGVLSQKAFTGKLDLSRVPIVEGIN